MKLWSLFNHPFPHCSWRNKNTCLQPDSCEWYKDHLKDIMKINWKELSCLRTSWNRKKEWMNERKKEKSLSCVWLFATPWTVAHQAPPSMEFSRQEYWNGLLFPSPGDLPDPGIEPGSPTLQADILLSEPPGNPMKQKYTSALEFL